MTHLSPSTQAAIERLRTAPATSDQGRRPPPPDPLALAACPMPQRCPMPCETCAVVARRVAAALEGSDHQGAPRHVQQGGGSVGGDAAMSVVYHGVRYMVPFFHQCESVHDAVCQALSEASACYASPKKITENGQTVWDADLQELDDFADSIGINSDYF